VQVDTHCKEINENDVNSFGAMHMLLIGDLHQMRPQSCSKILPECFTQSFCLDCMGLMASSQNSNTENIPARLFGLFENFELKGNKRAQHDAPYTAFIHKIRSCTSNAFLFRDHLKPIIDSKVLTASENVKDQT